MQTEIDKRFKAIEERISKLENGLKMTDSSLEEPKKPEVEYPKIVEKVHPVLEGLKKSAMLKEAEASVALDKGQTQTFSKEDLKERNKKNAKTK